MGYGRFVGRVGALAATALEETPVHRAVVQLSDVLPPEPAAPPGNPLLESLWGLARRAQSAAETPQTDGIAPNAVAAAAADDPADALPTDDTPAATAKAVLEMVLAPLEGLPLPASDAGDGLHFHGFSSMLNFEREGCHHRRGHLRRRRTGGHPHLQRGVPLESRRVADRLDGVPDHLVQGSAHHAEGVSG